MSKERISKKQKINLRYGKRIKRFRLKKHWSQEQFANECGLTRQAISEFENGRHKPSYRTLVKMEKIFDKPGCLRYARFKPSAIGVLITIETVLCIAILVIVVVFFHTF